MSETNSPIAVVNHVKRNGAFATKYNSAAIVIIENEKKIARNRRSRYLNKEENQ